MSIISVPDLTTIEWQPLADHTFTLLDGIDVVRVNIDTASSFFSEMLLPDEVQKMERFRNLQSRNQFLTSRGAVRYLSAKYTGREPLEFSWNEGPNKKPHWQNPGNELYFNIAHSGSYVVICFGRTEMGIDIERIQNEFAYEEILNRCFDIDEINAIRDAPEPLAVFYLLWTRKESLLKAVGMGILDDLTKVSCINDVYTTEAGDEWLLNSFVMEDNYLLSLACKAGTGLIRYWDFG
ncbi:MAG: 4'-phosphopantetheinyl transferase superfamily protein [Bacteroidota bacterium]